MQKRNLSIRKAAADSGVFLYEVADQLGVGEYTFCRRLRRELSEEEQDQVLAIIRDLAKEKEE